MSTQLSFAGAALALAAAALVPAAAGAQRYDGYHNQQQGYGGRGYDRGPDRRYDSRRYAYRDRRCSSGGTGTVVGAIAGGLLGRTIDTRGDRLGGTLLGGVAGALAGRAIDKSGNPRGCR